MNDVGRNNEQGSGLTFMSDRQKGLIKAFSAVTPKAEVRFCVRHIWENFKLHFPGLAYRDKFWKATKASSQNAFLEHMEAIKGMKEEAYNYLAAIALEHWSRHAFSTTSKSDALTNNLNETFNAVIRDARDKPILSLLEWIRRYVMQKLCENREGVANYKDQNMPYIEKHFKWAEEESKLCQAFASVVYVWEVEYKSTRHVLNLIKRECTCKYWQLTGIPCVHAYTYIHKQREQPHKFVDKYHSRIVYQLVYEGIISTLAGPQEWKRTNNPQPGPPAHRRLPGRPSEKKSRKEKGEDKGQKRDYVKRVRKRNKCSNCGQLGHNKNSCKNDAAPVKEKGKGVRPRSDDPFAVNAREKRHKSILAKHAAAMASQAETSCVDGHPETQQSQAETSYGDGHPETQQSQVSEN